MQRDLIKGPLMIGNRDFGSNLLDEVKTIFCDKHENDAGSGKLNFGDLPRCTSYLLTYI